MLYTEVIRFDNSLVVEYNIVFLRLVSQQAELGEPRFYELRGPIIVVSFPRMQTICRNFPFNQ